MPEQAPVRIALLNDHPLVVEGLSALLAPYSDRVRIEDVSVAAPVDALVDVALYDTYAARSDEHWSRLLGEGWTANHVVLFSWETAAGPSADESREDAPNIVQVPKSLDGAALVHALEQITRTGYYELDDSRQQQEQDTARRWPGQNEGLTERESEIVALITEGLSNEQLAAQLFLGINTVKTYIRSAYRKMGVTNRPHAVLWGIDHGFRPRRPSH